MPWSKLEHCRLKESYGNDGDSFHVVHDGKEFVFRLCFADCPETSISYPQRVREQGEWWGISDEDVVKAGKDAENFTLKLLRGKEFTVYTKYKDARGATKLGREFVMIKIGDKWLSEMLVAAGLARSYGYAVATPDGISRNDYRHKLDRLERIAKRKRLGAWSYSKKLKSRSNEDATLSHKEANLDGAGYKIVLTRATALYSADPSESFRGTLKAGTEITVLQQDGRMIKVRAPLHGKMVVGQCRRFDVGRLLKK